MHKLNNPETVGHDYYQKPPHGGSEQLEYLYNKVYGRLASVLRFSEEFNPSCLQDIEKYFEQFTASIIKVRDLDVEEGLWTGREGTIYDGVFLKVGFKTSDHPLPISAQLEFEETYEDKQKLVSRMYVNVTAACAHKEAMHTVYELLKPHTIIDKSKIYILTSTYGELSFNAMPMEPVESDLSLNYGESFLKHHEKLVDSLNKQNSGLYLFYGEPGTGKSSYIKHLLTGELKRRVAYIPVGLIGQLVAPDMLPLLMDNKDLILVIEDAEKALLSRENNEGSPVLVSALLNLTDGFIGQSLNISVIATFNTSKDNIDKALLRKGRLKFSYEFGPLEEKDAKKLAESLGKNPSLVTGPTTIADVYFLEDETGFKKEEQRRVGFF